MKVNTLSFLAILALGAGAAVPAQAHKGESEDVMIEINAPLDAVDCAATPPTITVLGLNIALPATPLTANHSDGGDDGDDDDDDDVGGGGTPCESLTVGEIVKVRLANDSVPLQATQVSSSQCERDGGDGGGSDPGFQGGGHHGGGDGDVSVQAPVQTVDPAAKTVTVLGLVVDASAAVVRGNDDDCVHEPVPVDLTKVVTGQFLRIRLDSAQLPALVATKVEIKNFTNQILVKVVDDHGRVVRDARNNVAVKVTQTVVLKRTGADGVTRVVRKRVQQTFRTRGSFVLVGLAKGKATIRVTRVAAGTQSAGKRTVVVAPNRRQGVVMSLVRTHTQ